jgi:large conductance mechanosensitive channel
MPVLSLAMGKVDLSNHFIVLSTQHVKTLAEAKQAGIPVIAYGTFIDTVIYFLIQVFAIFLIVRFALRLKKSEPAIAPKRLCPYCKTEIADDATRCPHCTSQL